MIQGTTGDHNPLIFNSQYNAGTDNNKKKDQFLMHGYNRCPACNASLKKIIRSFTGLFGIKIGNIKILF